MESECKKGRRQGRSMGQKRDRHIQTIKIQTRNVITVSELVAGAIQCVSCRNDAACAL